MFICTFDSGCTVATVSTSVKPFEKAGTWEFAEKDIQGRGVNRRLLNKFEYSVRSRGFSKFLSTNVSSSSHVIVESSRRVSNLLRTPMRQTVQSAIESIGVNCGKSIARSCVDGSNRSNCKMESGLGPSSFTYEKSVNGWITCINPSKPSGRLCTSSHFREILNEASAPVSKTLRNVSPSNLMGLAVVGGGRIVSGTRGVGGGPNTIEPRSHVLP